MAKPNYSKVPDRNPLLEYADTRNFQKFTPEGKLSDVEAVGRVFGLDAVATRAALASGELRKQNTLATTRYVYNGPNGEQSLFRIAGTGNQAASYAVDFPPLSGKLGGPIPFKLKGELLSKVVLRDPAYEGQNKTRLLLGWAQAQKSLASAMLPATEDKKNELGEQLRGPLVRWVATTVGLDADDKKLTDFDAVKEVGKLRDLVHLWKMRGYVQGDNVGLDETTTAVKNLYALAGFEGDALPPQFKHGADQPLVMALREELKVDAEEAGSTTYLSDDDFYLSFLALNMTTIRSSLFAAKHEASIPTTYKDTALPLSDDMKAKTGPWPEKGEARLMYLNAFNLFAGEEAKKLYVMQRVVDGVPLKDKRGNPQTVRLSQADFEQFRRESHPVFTLPDGQKGRYLNWDFAYNEKGVRQRGGKGYLFLITEGTDKDFVVKYSDKENIIKLNPELTSSNVRGSIRPYVTKFFEHMPKALADSLPQGDGLRALRDKIQARAEGEFLPIAVKLDKLTGEERDRGVDEELKRFFEPLAANGVTDVELERLEDFEMDRLGEVRQKVQRTITQCSVNHYLEGLASQPDSKISKPEGAYATAREQNKFEMWKRTLADQWSLDLRQPTEAEQFDKRFGEIIEQAVEHYKTKGFEGVVPKEHLNRLGLAVQPGVDIRVPYTQAVLGYVRDELKKVMTEMVETVKGTSLPQPVASLKEAGQAIDPKLLVLPYGRLVHNFSINFRMDKELPYISDQANRKRSERHLGIRKELKIDDFVGKKEWAAISLTRQKFIEEVVATKTTTNKLDKKEQLLLQAILGLKEQNAENPGDKRLGQMLVALHVKAGKPCPAELKQDQAAMGAQAKLLAGKIDLTPRSAQKVLEAYGFAPTRQMER